MKPLKGAREFWALPRAERHDRTAKAIDAGVCSVCSKPIADGEAMNGLVYAHWECADTGPAPTAADFDATFRKIDDALAVLKKL